MTLDMTLASMLSNLASRCKSQWWTEMAQVPSTLKKRIKLSFQGLRFPTCRGNYERDHCSRTGSEKYTEMIKKPDLCGLRVFHISTASERIFLSFPNKMSQDYLWQIFPHTWLKFHAERGVHGLEYPVCTHYYFAINKLFLGYIK